MTESSLLHALDRQNHWSISPTELRVMLFLSAQPAGATPRPAEISRELSISIQAACGAIKALSRRKLVRKSRNSGGSQDERAVFVTLLSKGADIIKDILNPSTTA